jgi:2-phospho-L-lactate guanylyltransferase
LSCWGLIAVKSCRAGESHQAGKRCHVGKSRLASACSEEERARLVSCMLEHVLHVARECPALDEVAVMSPKGCAFAPGSFSLRDMASDINESLSCAMRALEARGADRVALLPADLPRLRSEEIEALIEASRCTGLALAPDRHERGTNALCLALPSAFQPRFGPDSLARHLAQAASLGLKPAIVRSPGLAFDLDDPSDLAQWAAEAIAEADDRRGVHACMTLNGRSTTR